MKPFKNLNEYLIYNQTLPGKVFVRNLLNLKIRFN